MHFWKDEAYQKGEISFHGYYTTNEHDLKDELGLERYVWINFFSSLSLIFILPEKKSQKKENQKIILFLFFYLPGSLILSLFSFSFSFSIKKDKQAELSSVFCFFSFSFLFVLLYILCCTPNIIVSDNQMITNDKKSGK